MKTRLVTGIVISALVHTGLFTSSLLGRKTVGPDTPPEPPPAQRPDQIFLEPLDPDPAMSNDAANPDDPPPVRPHQAPDRPEPPQPHRITQILQPLAPAGEIDRVSLTHIPPGRPGEIARGIRVFDVSELKQKPTPRAQVSPRYPFDLKNAGIVGEVVVEFIVDPEGRVHNAVVVSSTHRGFDTAALQAIAQWRFNPGRQDGRAVHTRRVQQLFTFSLNQ
jgi:protein TonB